MGLSVFDLFKIGVGPSSSHTVGPMVAASRFLKQCESTLKQIKTIQVDLFGSLAMTGVGHGTDTAIILGLLGQLPDQVDPDQIPVFIQTVKTQRKLKLNQTLEIDFDPEKNIAFHMDQFLAAHSNGMTMKALDHNGIILCYNQYYSIGGGFVLDEEEIKQSAQARPQTQVPYPFESCQELLQKCQENQMTISELVLANEKVINRHQDYKKELLNIWKVMDACIKRGCQKTGILPGGLNVQRRAHDLQQKLLTQDSKDPLIVMDWVNLFALAVNEENAVGGRVVTAPTNGAAGVIPAVLAYYNHFISRDNEQGIIDFLATAAAIGMLYKKNASISAAEVGCQGEIGVACSMAAGALCAVMGGSNQQIENAAEIGMEHNLGLTCDPINGLVQVPCIERNTMGAIKAINAARLSLTGSEDQRVRLDDVIETMRQTGLDMKTKYKETATGGLAVNVVAC